MLVFLESLVFRCFSVCATLHSLITVALDLISFGDYESVQSFLVCYMLINGGEKLLVRVKLMKEKSCFVIKFV